MLKCDNCGTIDLVDIPNKDCTKCGWYPMEKVFPDPIVIVWKK